MSALTSNCIVPFSLTKRNDIGVGYANIYLETSLGAKYIPQYIQPNTSIYFNKFSKLASIAWLTGNELTFLKNGNFRIQFAINYTSQYGNVQTTLYVNDIPLTSTYGVITNMTPNVSQLNGEFTVRLLIGDTIKLVNTSGSYTIQSTGQINQILANLTVTEINNTCS